MGIRRVADLAWNRLLMRVDNSTGKGTSGMDKSLAYKNSSSSDAAENSGMDKSLAYKNSIVSWVYALSRQSKSAAARLRT